MDSSDGDQSPLRRAPRRPTKQEAASRAKAKGKKVAKEKQTVDSTSDSDSDRPVLQKKSAPKEKPKTPTYGEYFKKLMSLEFKGTKYPDHMLLEELGIQDEIRLMSRNMKLEKFFDMAFPGYQVATCQFLASLSMTHWRYSGRTQSDVEGFIEFRVNKKQYKMTFTELSSLFGFPPTGLSAHLFFPPGELNMLWETVATGTFKPGESKAALIRHPGIRYMHKMLAHTIFARRETGNVGEEEFGFLDIGLAPLSFGCKNGRRLEGNTIDTGIASFIIRHLLQIRDWARTTKDKTPQLSVGGIITPILEACGIVPADVKDGSRVGVTADIERLDAYYLRRTFFLAGRAGISYAYKFEYSHRNVVKVMLPNQSLTTFQEIENVAFLPPEAALYNPAIHPTLESIRQPGTKEHISTGQPSTANEGEEAQGDASKIYGSERYYFQPYAEPLPDNASREAHQQIKMLQRWNKWQDRTIKKLVKTVKGMKNQIKELKSKIAGSSSTRDQDVPTEHVAVEENIDDDAHRHSFQGTEAAPVNQEQPRSSSYERRRKRRATRSPTPCSSNMSHSMDTSDSVGF